MTFPSPSAAPGAGVSLVLLAAAWVFLALNRSAFLGTADAWVWLLAVVGLLLPLAGFALTVKDPHTAQGLLAAELMVVFLSSQPGAELLPVRYLVFAALVAQTATVLPNRWKVVFSFVLATVYVVIQHGLPGMTEPAPRWEITAVSLVFLAIPGYLLHLVKTTAARAEQLEERINQLHGSVLQLTSANTEFLEQANTASEESAASERHRITRELHDVVGQTLTNLIMMMDATLHRKVHEPEETIKLLRWIRTQAKTGLEETRAVLYELRALRPQRLRGLRSIKKLVETFGRLSRMTTRVHWGNLPWTFDPEQELAVYYLVQGALSNAFRHGTATGIELHFHVDNGELSILIRDNGRGGPDAEPGIGQKSMEERLAPWGGAVSFRSEAFGYQVTATLPLKEEKLGAVQDPDRR